MATWKLATNSVAGNAVTAGIGVATTTVAMDALGLHPIAGAGAVAVGSLLHLVAAGMESPTRVGVNLARWGAAGGWMTWALASDPWTLTGVGALAVGSAAGAVLGPWLKRREKAPARSREGGHALVLGSTGRRNLEWSQRISRVRHQGRGVRHRRLGQRVRVQRGSHPPRGWGHPPGPGP